MEVEVTKRIHQPKLRNEKHNHFRPLHETHAWQKNHKTLLADQLFFKSVAEPFISQFLSNTVVLQKFFPRLKKNQNKILISQSGESLSDFVFGKYSHTGVVAEGTVALQADDFVDSFEGGANGGKSVSYN